LVPDNPFTDSDGDGLTDADEAIHGTNPNNPDTDGDGLSDGAEVRVHGTSPLRVDSDCDGLTDAEELGPPMGRPATNPRNPDTDGDGLPDGLEVGVTANPDPTNCPGVVVDACPQGTTNPIARDTDGDGLADGAEDANQNGCVDAGGDGGPTETDPNNPNDGQGVVGVACSEGSLRPVLFHASTETNVQTARIPSFQEVSELTVDGQRVGALYYDADDGIAAFVVTKLPAGADVAAEESAGRASFDAVGTIAAPTTQSFATWDGFGAILGQYDWGGGGDLKTKVNQAVTLLLGSPANLAGLFPDNAGIPGPHPLRVEYVRRSDQQAVVFGAAAGAAGFNAAQDIRLLDLANGSALADAYDTTSVQCDRFFSGPSPKVDFLWVIDNSGSMGDDQDALSAAANEIANQLATAGIDWRMAVTYTDLHVAPSADAGADVCDGGPGPGRRRICPFTTDINLFRNGSAQCAYVRAGTCGSGSERGFNSARRALDVFLAADGGCEPVTGGSCSLRPDARLVLIFFTDTGEQTPSSQAPPGQDGGNTPADWASYFRRTPPDGGSLVHGVLCPLRPDGGPGPCTDNLTSSAQYDRYSDVLRSLGGVEGSIRDVDQPQLPQTITRILNAVLGAVSRLRLSKAPISATLKVVLERPSAPGGAVDVPRGNVNGFDYSGAANTIVLLGSFFPDAPGREVAISYRYWQDRSKPPDTPQCPSCAPPLTCDPQTLTCVCPSDCGSPPPSTRHRCDTLSCAWVCAADCNGECTGYRTCDTQACACACEQSVTCAPGFSFDPGACECRCLTEALGCGPRHDADPGLCACVCKPDCGGCGIEEVCNPSLCECIVE
jgi:hypothetical protein